MSDVKWIKITTNIFDDEKIKLIETLPDADTLIVIWFKLLALAGKCNDHGLVYLTRDIPYNTEMLSTILRRPVNTIRLALSEFQNLKMIEIINDFISVVNWEKHQDLHKLEMAKENTRQRVQKYRERNREACNANVTNVCNVTVTECNADRIDKIRLDKNRKEYNNDDSFNEFWNLYDKKVNPKVCKQYWNKINPDLHGIIFKHIADYVKNTPDKKYRKDPERYLKHELWQSEIITKDESKNNDTEWWEQYATDIKKDDDVSL